MYYVQPLTSNSARKLFDLDISRWKNKRPFSRIIDSGSRKKHKLQVIIMFRSLSLSLFRPESNNNIILIYSGGCVCAYRKLRATVMYTHTHINVYIIILYTRCGACGRIGIRRLLSIHHLQQCMTMIRRPTFANYYPKMAVTVAVDIQATRWAVHSIMRPSLAHHGQYPSFAAASDGNRDGRR